MFQLTNVLRQGWLTLLTGSVQTAIRAAGAPTVHASGPLPYRLLLLGGGAAVGLGVSRHDRALPGHLARHLASITSHGVDLDVTARLGMTLDDARTEVDRLQLTGYDAIVLTLGTADALSALPTEQWRERLELLLTALLNKTCADTQILAIGAHESSWAPYLHPRVTRLASHRLTAYNRVCRELCWSLPRTSYLAAHEKPSAPTDQFTVLDYDRIGRTVAAHLARRLTSPGASPTAHSLDTAANNTTGPLEPTKQGPKAAIDRAVARTRGAFGVAGATVTLLRPTEVALRDAAPSYHSESPAAVAAQGRGLAVTNLREDARFRNGALARRHGIGFYALHYAMVVVIAMSIGLFAPPFGIGFYAAHPIYAPTGEPVAVLAIFDPQPRTFSVPEMAVLRDHALLIEDLILVQDLIAVAPRKSPTPRRVRSQSEVHHSHPKSTK